MDDRFEVREEFPVSAFPRLFQVRWTPLLALTLLVIAQCSPPSTGFAQEEFPTGSSAQEKEKPPAEAATKELIPTDPVQLFLAGGILMWPILGASILAIWIAVERMIVLRKARVIPRAFVSRFVKHVESGKLDQDQALRLCEENGSPMAMVFAHGIRKWGKPSVEVEQAIIDGGEREVGHLRKHLSILNGVYTISPLLGLLGTVVGMIMSFNELAAGSTMGASSSERLAGGIAVALLTTAAGLSVAIPALVLYMYFVGRVDALVMEMDRLAQRVVNSISEEGLEAQEAAAPVRPAQVGRS